MFLLESKTGAVSRIQSIVAVVWLVQRR